MQSSKRLITAAYQTPFILHEITSLESMRKEVECANAIMQAELEKAREAEQVVENKSENNLAEQGESISEESVAEPLEQNLLQQVVEDSAPNIGKSKIVRAMEDLKSKIRNLFANRARKGSKEADAAKKTNTEIE